MKKAFVKINLQNFSFSPYDLINVLPEMMPFDSQVFQKPTPKKLLGVKSQLESPHNKTKNLESYQDLQFKKN